MKKVNLITLLLLLTHLAIGQTSAKRYIMLEHFTNSRCSNCASQNPGFFNTIAGFADDVHHIAYHPPIPYNNCIFYQANTTENSARATFYSIPGTPRVLRNGQNPANANQVSAAVLQGLVDQTSPIVVEVTETSGNNRLATINVRTLGDKPAGTYRLYAAIAEREVAYNAPNGEPLHRNVFRRMLTNISGDPITLANSGGMTSAALTYTVENGWNANEIYVLAFVQNLDTKEILNSGTRFDPAIVSDVDDVNNAASFKIFPNPASGLTTIQFQEALSGTISLVDVRGSALWSNRVENEQTTAVDMSSYPAGVYVLRIQSDKGLSEQKIVRQ